LLEERFVLKEESPNQRIDKGLYFFSWEKTRKSSGYMIQKHVAFAPASQKQLGSRLCSPLLSSRNHARSAFLTVFSPYSLRLAFLLINGAYPHFFACLPFF
jgi:hypothetical protein